MKNGLCIFIFFGLRKKRVKRQQAFVAPLPSTPPAHFDISEKASEEVQGQFHEQGPGGEKMLGV
jgi:hypothetical protein